MSGDEPAIPAGARASQGAHPGERMYREGMLPDGKAMQALIADDIPVDGHMFTCVNCHRRSGLGSVEGSVVTWPINGEELFVPRRRTGAWSPAAEGHGPGAAERWSLPTHYQAVAARPAYTEETLARVIRTGVGADGQELSGAMPRYSLADKDMAILIDYLKNLSAGSDPGVDENTLRFATVVTDDVSETDRDAMLAVLQAHIDSRNTQTRPHLRRAKEGPFFMTEMYGAYRKLELDVWRIKGPPDTWREQLEQYYRMKPVFALLGGISSGTWAPIHEFCEDYGIPSIFPVTDQPVVSATDWYTLYLSKGSYQEGEAAARFLMTSLPVKQETRIVQVYRQGRAGEMIARGFEETWLRYGRGSLETLPLGADDELTVQEWLGPADARPSTALLLWVDADEVTEILGNRAIKDGGGGMIFASGSLLEDALNHIPVDARDALYLTYPRSLPGEHADRTVSLRRWLTARGIPVTNIEIQARMYFLGWILPSAIKHMRGEFHRDYFLEGFDMMTDQNYAIAVYPRVSFGPGQRYASKGCYVVQLAGGEHPEFRKVSNWVIN